MNPKTKQKITYHNQALKIDPKVKARMNEMLFWLNEGKQEAEANFAKERQKLEDECDDLRRQLEMKDFEIEELKKLMEKGVIGEKYSREYAKFLDSLTKQGRKEVRAEFVKMLDDFKWEKDFVFTESLTRKLARIMHNADIDRIKSRLLSKQEEK